MLTMCGRPYTALQTSPSPFELKISTLDTPGLWNIPTILVILHIFIFKLGRRRGQMDVKETDGQDP